MQWTLVRGEIIEAIGLGTLLGLGVVAILWFPMDLDWCLQPSRSRL